VGAVQVRGFCDCLGRDRQTLIRRADGNVWFTGYASGASIIGYITPSDAVKTFALPQNTLASGNLTIGSDDQLWFVDTSFGIRWITAKGDVGGYPIPMAPNGIVNVIASSADGSFWVATDNAEGVAGLTHLAF
jgi:streptogramin lyase